jgi:hypothetical protein
MKMLKMLSPPPCRPSLPCLQRWTEFVLPCRHPVGACLHEETQAVLAHYAGEVVCRRDGVVACSFPSLAAAAAARAAAGGGGGDAVGALAVVPGELRGRGQLVEREAVFTRASVAQQRLAAGLAAVNLAMAALLVPLALV